MKRRFGRILSKYNTNTEFIKNRKKDVIFGTIITFIQRIFLFSITYVIYLGLGLKGISYFELLLLQIFTQITIEGLPLPGGTGALEAIINKVYFVIFGSYTIVGTVLTRTFSFYLPLIVTMFIIIIITKLKYMRKNVIKKSED